MTSVMPKMLCHKTVLAAELVKLEFSQRSTAVHRRSQMSTFTKILSPIDFSDPSQAALATAASLAKQFNAELLLVHIVPAIPDLPSSVSMLKEGQYDESLHTDAATRLAEMALKLKQSGIKAESTIGTANDTAMEIIRQADENDADLIVIATHGLSGLHALVFGSVTEKVLRESHVPVLVMHTTKAAEEAKSSAA
jgi:nucleotide-binding universal stress UspA family protein